MTTNVEIEYCVPCGHLNWAVDTQRAILEHFGREIYGVRLKTGHGGVFTIRVDGEQVYDKTKGFDLDQIIADIEART
ncbi:MAG TPA: Rdx family protein [Acidimicrobiia bacterium]|jgi:selenoprotein W-related protein|nr:Rdx family protein [Acidimicrobiia bacterium]